MIKQDLVHEKLSGAIIGAAIDVLNALRPGVDEKVYENALLLELQARGHGVEQQTRFPIRYRGTLVGSIPDLIVDNEVIVDPKVVTGFNDTHIAQMLGYLSITGLDLSLLLNFKNARLAWKRVVACDNAAESSDVISF